MTVNPGEEFRLSATPSQELLRKLAYLAEQGSDAVLTGGAGPRRDGDGPGSRGKGEGLSPLMQQVMIAQARLADPAYQAASARITGDLDLMDQSCVDALQQIEQELRAVRRERQRMLEESYRDEDDNAIFMTADQTGAYYEDGRAVDDDTFALIQGQLSGRPTWDDWQAGLDRENALNEERDAIHDLQAQGDALREDLATGNISIEEAERREAEIRAAMPERVRPVYDGLRGEPDPEEAATPPAPELSADELAALGARSGPATGQPASAGDAPQGAGTPRPPGAGPF